MAKTIEKIQKEYVENKEDIISPALLNIAQKHLDRRESLTFENDSYADALALTELMFDHTTSSIKILSGSECDSFLEILKDSFERALGRIQTANGNAQLIILSPKIPAYLQKLRQRFSCLDMIKASVKQPIEHFIVCDDDIVREEKVHGELSPNSPADAIKADVYFYDMRKASESRIIFDKVWETLKAQIAKSKTD